MEIRESWFQEGDLDDVARVTATVDPRIRAAGKKHRQSPPLSRLAFYGIDTQRDTHRVKAKLLLIHVQVAKTPSCLDWKICYRDPLPTWVSPRSHSIALLGDSCHPHLPTSAQGASQATESAAVLAVCLQLAGKERISLAVSEAIVTAISSDPS